MKYYDALFSHLILETETMNEIKKIIKKRKKVTNISQEGKSKQKEHDDEA